MKNKHAWLLSDLASKPSNGIKVMTTFSCGGGSSMGYKLAGCDVVAANDIDPEMAYHYRLNLKPKHYFLCPVKGLLSKELPAELFDLDILDGSPPCSSFSMAGNREKDWGKNKHFREGQAKQVLDDLFFDYIDLVDKLKPKVSIAENVTGLMLGNAKGYLKMIFAKYREIGYSPQLFVVNAADCGVPQARKRVFFCAARLDLNKQPLFLKFNNEWISAEDAISDLQLTETELEETKPTGTDLRFWAKTKEGKRYEAACKEETGKNSFFNHVKFSRRKPASTLTSNPVCFTHWDECRAFSFREWARFGSFPDDYAVKTPRIGKYMIGMSAPPRMTECVARAVIDQWLAPR
jgi:DNA (cytosine-5)-methyltransferase 1